MRPPPNFWHYPRSTRRSRVYVTVACPSVCPSICPSHHSTAAAANDGFAAERRVGRRYRSTAAGVGRPAATAPQHEAAARRSAANMASDVLTTDEAE